MSGITEGRLDALVSSVGVEQVLMAGQEYEAARRLWNQAVSSRPLAIVRCCHSSDVQSTVQFAVDHGLSLSVCGGGHHWSGSAMSGELVVDLRGMRNVEIRGEIAMVDGGATSMDVAEAAAQYGLVPVTGNLGAVGIAGLTLGGGYGPLTGYAGLASDNLLAAAVVTSDGRIRETNDERDPDLLWALRGGGGNFGVVTSLSLKLHRVDNLLAGTIMFPIEQAQRVAVVLSQLQSRAPDSLTLTTAFAELPEGKLVVAVLPAWTGPQSENDRIIRDLVDLGKPSHVSIARSSYVQMLKDTEAFSAPNVSALNRSVTVDSLQPQAIQAVIDAMRQRASPLSYIVIHSFHGAAQRIQPSATAFALRQEHFVIGICAVWREGEHRSDQEWAAALEEALLPFSLRGAYPNYLGADRSATADEWFGANLARLRRIKALYDPQNIFNAWGMRLRP